MDTATKIRRTRDTKMKVQGDLLLTDTAAITTARVVTRKVIEKTISKTPWQSTGVF